MQYAFFVPLVFMENSTKFEDEETFNPTTTEMDMDKISVGVEFRPGLSSVFFAGYPGFLHHHIQLPSHDLAAIW